MDYDELTLNPLLSEIEAEASSSEPDAEKKHRRYWTPKEEERFYELWGRENWRLTRNGKNTIFFALWSDELNERWKIDVKPEEVQAKVNQTKAKYRQVCKVMETEKTNVPKWKKFEIIHKILSNTYRPKDAEPIPPDALEKSKEFSPVHPGPIAAAPVAAAGAGADCASSAEENPTDLAAAQLIELAQQQDTIARAAVETMNQSTELNPLNAGSIFNTSDTQRNSSQFSTELFSDSIDEIKQEEFTDEFGAFEMQQNNMLNSQGVTQMPLINIDTQQQHQQLQQQQQQQLHQLQQQQQQYQQEQYQAPQNQATNMQTQQQQLQQQIQLQHQQHQVPTQLQQQLQQPLEQQQQQPQQQSPQYDQPLNSYATPTSRTPSTNSRSLLVKKRNHYNNTSTTRRARHSSNNTTEQQQYANNSAVNATTAVADDLPVSVSNNGTSNNGSGARKSNNMQPPSDANAVVSAPPKRIRRTAAAMHAAAVAAAASAPDSLESQYLEEVRKKNLILDEQKEIARKRMHLEERKISLMEQFFPQCLALQQQILQKLNSK